MEFNETRFSTEQTVVKSEGMYPNTERSIYQSGGQTELYLSRKISKTERNTEADNEGTESLLIHDNSIRTK